MRRGVEATDGRYIWEEERHSMDLSDPGLMFSGLVISMIGLGFFIHGKKMERLRNLFIGLAMVIIVATILFLSRGRAVELL